MRSLPERLTAAASAERGITFVDADERTFVSHAELHDAALGIAAALQARGIGPGSHVALLGPTTRALVTTIRGIWMSGATLVVLPLPMRLASLDVFVEQTRLRIRQADVSLVLVDPDLAPFVEPRPEDPPMVLLPELAAEADASRYRDVTVDPADLGVLQFTSGSTADPKGVMLPHRDDLGEPRCDLRAAAELSSG